MKKVITHDGIFHADDVMSVALVKEFIDAEVPVERTRNISTEDIDNPEIWVVDVGKKFDAFKCNFDHHHDPKLEASCLMVLKYIYFINGMNGDVYHELHPLISVISDIDRIGPCGEYGGFQMNTLIKSFNALENGFDVAVDVCRKWIKASVITAEQGSVSKKIWDSGEIFMDVVRICTGFPLHWKRYDEQPFLIYPNGGKWNVISINSSTHPLSSTGKEEFIHSGKFIAVFANLNDAKECILSSIQ